MSLRRNHTQFIITFKESTNLRGCPAFDVWNKKTFSIIVASISQWNLRRYLSLKTKWNWKEKEGLMSISIVYWICSFVRSTGWNITLFHIFTLTPIRFAFHRLLYWFQVFSDKNHLNWIRPFNFLGHTIISYRFSNLFSIDTSIHKLLET